MSETRLHADGLAEDLRLARARIKRSTAVSSRRWYTHLEALDLLDARTKELKDLEGERIEQEAYISRLRIENAHLRGRLGTLLRTGSNRIGEGTMATAQERGEVKRAARAALAKKEESRD